MVAQPPLLENALREDQPSLWDSEHTEDVHSRLTRMPGFEGFWFSYRTSSSKSVHAR